MVSTVGVMGHSLSNWISALARLALVEGPMAFRCVSACIQVVSDKYSYLAPPTSTDSRATSYPLTSSQIQSASRCRQSNVMSGQSYFSSQECRWASSYVHSTSLTLFRQPLSMNIGREFQHFPHRPMLPTVPLHTGIDIGTNKI